MPDWLALVQGVADVFWKLAFGGLVLVLSPKALAALRTWHQVQHSQLLAERDIERQRREAVEGTLLRQSGSLDVLERERQSLIRQLQEAQKQLANPIALGSPEHADHLAHVLADLMLAAIAVEIAYYGGVHASDTAKRIEADRTKRAIAIATHEDQYHLRGLAYLQPQLLHGQADAVAKTVYSVAGISSEPAAVLERAKEFVCEHSEFPKLQALGWTLHREMTIAKQFGLPLGPPDKVSLNKWGLGFDRSRMEG